MLHGRGQCRGGELTHGSAHVSLPRAVRARALYLHVVCLTCTRTAQVVSEATVEPVGADDWEVVELHAGEIEDQLLNQVLSEKRMKLKISGSEVYYTASLVMLKKS